MPDNEMKKFLAGVRGVCEANSYEKHGLWCDYAQEALDSKCVADARERIRYSWVSDSSGLMQQVGTFGGMPVVISMFKSKVNGYWILFYYACSMVTHSDMVRKWLEENLPVTAFEDNDPRGRMNREDATNFCNVLHSLKWQDERKLQEAA
jgi:hypothetical protein